MPFVRRIEVDPKTLKKFERRTKAELRQALHNPALTAEQKEEIRRRIKQVRPDLLTITDVCMCAYTSHGHCGVLTVNGEIDNDRTLELLSRMAELHAAAGAIRIRPLY